jgi:hypothetical protein
MPCYQDWEYKYEDDGNHNNIKYKYKHNSYSDHYKPDHTKSAHCESNPTPYKPDHYNPKHNNNEYRYKVTGEGYEHGELKGERMDKVNGAMDKSEEMVYNEHKVLIYNDNNEIHELIELKWMDNEEGHEPQAPKHHNGSTQGTSKYRHNEDNKVHTFTCAYVQSTPMHEPDTDEQFKLKCMYVKWGHEAPTMLYNEHGETSSPTHAHTLTTPSLPHSPTPSTSTCPLHMLPSLNTSKSCEPVKPAHTPSLYFNLNNLHQNYSIRIPSALPTYRNFRSTLKGACANRRNGVWTGRWKSTKITISTTPSRTTPPDHDHGMQLMNPKMAYPTSSRDCALYILD